MTAKARMALGSVIFATFLAAAAPLTLAAQTPLTGSATIAAGQTVAPSSLKPPARVASDATPAPLTSSPADPGGSAPVSPPSQTAAGDAATPQLAAPEAGADSSAATTRTQPSGAAGPDKPSPAPGGEPVPAPGDGPAPAPGDGPVVSPVPSSTPSPTPSPAPSAPEGSPPKAVTAPVAATATPTVILVHSELLDGSAWRRVIPLLERAGVRAQAVQLPLNSMWADVAVIQRALAVVRGPVILVGHSWGGVVITEAGVDSKVAALVYVAAMAPDVGQSFIDRLRNAPRGPGLGRLLTDASGFVRLADDAFAVDFSQDLDPEQNRLLAATQSPVFGKVFEERVNNAAWKNLPTWYVVASNDRMLDPGAQQTEAGRIKARVTAVPGSHAIMLSQPEAIAKVILEAVAAVRSGGSVGHEGAAQPLQPLVPRPDPAKK